MFCFFVAVLQLFYRIEAFEMWCWRKMLSISWEEHRANDSILTELGWKEN